jgi:hypothetical protein
VKYTSCGWGVTLGYRKTMESFLESTELMPYQTDVSSVFAAFGGKQNEYNWLITDMELNQYPEEFIDQEKVWISGEALTELLSRFHTQFIWGVLSGFKKDDKADIDRLKVTPKAITKKLDDYKIQHPLAFVQIICFDSSQTYLFSKDEELAKKFKDYFKSDAMWIEK